MDKALDVRDFTRDGCSVALALGIVGERWSLLVLREAFYGIRRFDEMQAALGCARNLLADRLGTLVAEGILRKVPYQDPGQRLRHEYRLTEKGLELFPIVIALLQWGDRWRADPDGAPVEVLHRGCGGHVRAELRCEHGHHGLTARDTTPAPLPGAVRRPAEP